MTTVLDEARSHLFREYTAAIDRNDERAKLILDPLSTVADLTCRIGDQWHSHHYHADKAGDMVQAALLLRRRAMVEYAEHEGARQSDVDAIHDIAAAASEVESAIERIMWGLARGGVEREALDALADAVFDLQAVRQ